MQAADYDIAVVGGGMVGSAIGYGLAKRGARVVVLDEGDAAIRSARVNFGLVWVQSKGDGMPAYARWTRRSADLWDVFAAELTEATGISPEHEHRGGLAYCLGEDGFEARRTAILRLHNQAGPEVYGLEMLERPALERMLPGLRLGPEVTGASYCPHDGCANPLLLLRALHAAPQRAGGAYRPDAPARGAPGRRRLHYRHAGGAGPRRKAGARRRARHAGSGRPARAARADARAARADPGDRTAATLSAAPLQWPAPDRGRHGPARRDARGRCRDGHRNDARRRGLARRRGAARAAGPRAGALRARLGRAAHPLARWLPGLSPLRGASRRLCRDLPFRRDACRRARQRPRRGDPRRPPA